MRRQRDRRSGDRAGGQKTAGDGLGPPPQPSQSGRNAETGTGRSLGWTLSLPPSPSASTRGLLAVCHLWLTVLECSPALGLGRGGTER